MEYKALLVKIVPRVPLVTDVRIRGLIDSSIFHLQYILRRRSSRSERLRLGIVSMGWC
jgi:hypothetical protein